MLSLPTECSELEEAESWSLFIALLLGDPEAEGWSLLVEMLDDPEVEEVRLLLYCGLYVGQS